MNYIMNKTMTEIPRSTIEAGAEFLKDERHSSDCYEYAKKAEQFIQRLLDDGGLMLASDEVAVLAAHGYPPGGVSAVHRRFTRDEITRRVEVEAELAATRQLAAHHIEGQREAEAELAQEREDHDRLYENGLERDRRLRLALSVVEATRAVLDTFEDWATNKKDHIGSLVQLRSALAAYDKGERVPVPITNEMVDAICEAASPGHLARLRNQVSLHNLIETRKQVRAALDAALNGGKDGTN